MPAVDPITGLKHCADRDCRETDLKAFGKDRSKVDGLNKYCKACYKTRSAAYRNDRREHLRAYHAAWEKENKERLQAYRAENYSPEKEREYRRAWAEANPDKAEARKTRVRAWHKDNKEHVRAQTAKWYQDNREHSLLKARKRYAENRELHTVRMREWKRANPDKAGVLRQRYRARKLALPVQWTADDWVECLDYFGHRCAYCGRGDDELTQDHVIPLDDSHLSEEFKGMGGTVPWNMVPACGSCNSSKRNKDPFEHIEFGPLWLHLLGRIIQQPNGEIGAVYCAGI